jgi:hypothetical protein
VIYIFTPLLWSSLNQGRIEILVLYLLAPLFIFIKPLMVRISTLSWRRVFAITLLISTSLSFTPLLLAGWLLIQLSLLAREAFTLIRGEERVAGWIDFLESKSFGPVAKRFAAVTTSFLLTLPWSLGALIHPTQFLLAPGIPLANGGVLPTLMANPGGIGAPPWWVVAPITLFILFSFFIRSLRHVAIKSATLLAGAILLNALHISGHGATEAVYVGAIFLVIYIVLIPPMLIAIERVTPNLRIRNLGVGHLAIAGATALSFLAAIFFGGWILLGESSSLVRSDRSGLLPAFVSALAQSPAKPKTLVLSSTPTEASFFISRGNPLSLGDADVATAIPSQIEETVRQLVSGSAVDTANILGSFGIQYLYLKAPVSLQTARAVDGVGGFTRMSSTQIGIVWRIVGSSPRVTLKGPQGTSYLIPAGDIGAQGIAPIAGQILLAEKYDRSWRLIDNGVSIPLEHATSGLPIFSVTAPGKVTILFDGTTHRGLISLQLLTVLIASVMALPSGRRRRQVPLEELV